MSREELYDNCIPLTVSIKQKEKKIKKKNKKKNQLNFKYKA